MPGIDPDPAAVERRQLRRLLAEAALSEQHERFAWAIYTESGLLAATTYIEAMMEAPMTPLSDERLVAIRERWERGDSVGWSAAIGTIGEAVQTIAVLLDEVERLRTRVTRLEGVLRDVEWTADVETERMFAFCPRCRSYDKDHAPDCELDAALRDAHE